MYTTSKFSTKSWLILSMLSIASIFSSNQSNAADDGTQKTVYELRIYTCNEGKLPALHKRFKDHTLKLFEKHGMSNLIYWNPQDEKLKENTLFYLIAHKDRESADQSWKGFLADADWQKAYKASTTDGKLVKKVERFFLTPTDYSPDFMAKMIQEKKPQLPEGSLYELRTYTTNPGKLPNLHKRFRDHTVGLFKKHGMTNVFYATTDDPNLKDKTLIYFVTHKDAAAAAASWAGFRGDSEWTTAYKKSIEDGKIVTKVVSQKLTPTDYSPQK